MSLEALIGVEEADRDDLDSLAGEVGSDPALETRALDGATIVQVLIPISLATLAVVRAWLLARLEKHKTSSVTWKGRKFVGYSADEVAEIIAALEREVGEGNG
jgi:hypothetical protein